MRAAGDLANLADNARRRCAAPGVVHFVPRPQTEFERRLARVEQLRQPLAGREPLLGVLSLDGRGPAPMGNLLLLFTQGAQQVCPVFRHGEGSSRRDEWGGGTWNCTVGCHFAAGGNEAVCGR